MDPGALMPTPDAIPAPWWVFALLGGVTFTVHIVLVDLIVGGTLFALAGRLLGEGSAAARLSAPTEKLLPTLVALTINVGVAPLLFTQVIYGQAYYASSVILGWTWMAVIPVLILAYYGTYVFVLNKDDRPAVATAGLAVSLALFAFIAFAFVSNFSLTQRPEAWSRYFGSPSGSLNLDDPTFFPRYLHMILAMVAVAALGSPLMGRLRTRFGDTHTWAPDLDALALQVYAWTTAVQLGIGLWFLVALPSTAKAAMMGGDVLLTASFGLGFLLAIGSTVTAFLGRFWPTAALLGGTLVSMVALRAFLRDATLREFAGPAKLDVVPQTFNTVLFLGTFALGLVVAALLVRGAFAPREQQA